MTAPAVRYIVLSREAPEVLLPGLCPACDKPLDDGCRITRICAVTGDPLDTGIQRVFEVWCINDPLYQVVECACAH